MTALDVFSFYEWCFFLHLDQSVKDFLFKGQKRKQMNWTLPPHSWARQGENLHTGHIKKQSNLKTDSLLLTLIEYVFA